MFMASRQQRLCLESGHCPIKFLSKILSGFHRDVELLEQPGKMAIQKLETRDFKLGQ
jgi:hypothetical protein